MLQRNYDNLFSGLATTLPKALDRSHFFLADSLGFEPATLYESATSKITENIILPMIGPSRIFSYSMFIESIVNLRDMLSYEQTIELCLAASLMNTPFWFAHILSRLKNRHQDSADPFQFSSHPFFDWLAETIRVFNDGSGVSLDEMEDKEIRWQTSLHKRFPPVAERLFRHNLGHTQAQRSLNERKGKEC